MDSFSHHMEFIEHGTKGPLTKTLKLAVAGLSRSVQQCHLVPSYGSVLGPKMRTEDTLGNPLLARPERTTSIQSPISITPCPLSPLPASSHAHLFTPPLLPSLSSASFIESSSTLHEVPVKMFGISELRALRRQLSFQPFYCVPLEEFWTL